MLGKYKTGEQQAIHEPLPGRRIESLVSLGTLNEAARFSRYREILNSWTND